MVRLSIYLCGKSNRGGSGLSNLSLFDSYFIACFHLDAHPLVACLVFLISHKPNTRFWLTGRVNSSAAQHSYCHQVLFLCMNASKRTSRPKPAARELSQGIPCRHKCFSVGTRAAASVLLAQDLFWGRMGHLRTHSIWGMEFVQLQDRIMPCCTLILLLFYFIYFISFHFILFYYFPLSWSS